MQDRMSRSKIEVSLSSAEGQKSVTEVKATVLLTQQPQCNQILRLQNVQVIGSDGKKHGHIPDVDKPIRLNYHDGHLEDSICVTPGDTQNSLNIKRAIASIFQANLKPGHETDVFGRCPTEVSHHKEGNVLVVQKARNLNRCSYREHIRQDFFRTTYNLDSEIKASPLLNADYSAKLRIKNGILDQATIHEEYLYIPFSVGNNGAKASVETTLKYVGTAKDNAQAKVDQPRSIIFEDPHPVNAPNANVNSILAAVKQTAKTIDVTVGEHTAKEFTNLIKILRVSKKDDLLAVYNQVRAGVGFADKAAAKKLFLDALLRAGNGDNIEVAIELLKSKELNQIEQNLVYLGLSVVGHPTEGSLNAATNLLSQPNLPREAYLGIGNLAGRYCQQHSCNKVDALNKLVQKLAQKIGSGKATNRQQENDIVYALKALTNIHHLNDGILAKIASIAQDKKAANRLRVAALESYLADPCKDKLRDSALGILKDIQQDSEIRIKAYLAVAACPNTKVSNAVKTLLENEPSYQVGGFIVSHIRNLRSSANPDKELAKQHLGLINVPNRFPIDPRKYSANAEFSYTIDSLGVANSIETNVIYSQNSFLPRSSSLNLNAEVFGHNFNFLEIETRQENLDRLLEHYLGPKGLLRSRSLKDLWEGKADHARNIIKELRDKVEKTLRSRRDVSKSELDHIARQVQIKTNSLNTDLDLDLGVKAFGSEILFYNVNDDVQKWTPESIIDKIVDGLSTGLDKIKHFEETLRSNMLFLDAELAYPTAAGFPLRLGVEGSANLQVKASGAIDVRALLKQPSTVKIALIPSANVQVAGSLTVDALVVESGLKVVSSLHTATGGDLVVNLLANGVDVKFSLPLEKQDLVSATHDIVFVSREWGAPEVYHPLKFAQNKDFSICFDHLIPFIGLGFCGEITGPNLQGKQVPILPFPLSGDAKIAISIDREDLSHYHYKELFHNTHDKVGAEFVLEAVGKNGQKKTSIELDAFLVPEKVIRATLTSPILTGLVEGRITTTENENSVSVRLVQDKNEYFGKIGVAVQGSAARSVYKPILLYKTPQMSENQPLPYRVEGQVTVENKGPGNTIYTLDNVRLVIPNQKSISVNGKFGTEPETLFADVTTSDGQNSASFNGKLRVNPNLIKYNAELRNNLNPEANVHLKGELSRSGDEIKNFFQIAHGGDFSNKNNILTIEDSFKYRNKGPHDFLVETKNKLTYPNFGANLQFDFELKPKAVQYDLNIQYSNVKLGSELEWEHNQKREGTEFKIEFGIWGLNNRLNLKAKRQITGENSHIENSLEVNGFRAEVNGKIKHHIRPQDVDVAADLVIKVSTANTPLHVVSGLKLNANEIDASHKVTGGNVVYVDIFFKANKVGNANGSIKVNLQGQLVITGQVKANKGSGSGDVTIELPGVKRTSKIDTTFTVHDPTYNILINIYPVFNQDKSKKITLSTHSTIKSQNVDSKNVIDFFGNRLEANVKGNIQGDLENGKLNGEVEVTLPNQNYLSAKINRELRNVNHVLNGNVQLTAEHRSNKNQPGNKLSVKGQLKNTNFKERVFDINYQISAERANGQNINLDLVAKRHPQGDVVNVEFGTKLYGSAVGSPLETTVRDSYRNLVGDFSVKSSYAPLGKVVVNGKYDVTGSGKPVNGEINVELTSSSKTLRSLRAGVSGSVLKGDVIDVKGQINVYADAPDGVIVDVNSNGEVRASDKEGRVKGTIRSGKLDPITIDTGFTRSDKQVRGDVSAQYGKNQNVKGDVTLIRLSPHEYKLDLKLDTPNENFRNNRLQVHTKRNEDNTHHQSEVIATSNGKTWTTNTDFVLSELTPSIDIKVKCPEGKLRQLSAKITKLSDRQLGAELKIVNQKNNFLLEGSIDANVETIEDFHVKVTANSPYLKIDKIVAEAQSKPAKGGRRIQVTAKSANKNILAGSTSYTAREEHGKLIVEGSGSFKVHDKTKSANFKYIRQNLSQDKNGETGIEISFDAGLGNQAIDAELKVTNKQFRILNSYCEEKKQCAHVEIDIKTITDTVSQFNQEIEIAIDLRKLGLSHEFGLKAVTSRKEYVLDHTVDVHFQSQENSKYQYSLYLHPKEAGVSLTTPKRIIALEAKVNTPQNLLRDGGRVSGEAVLYLDKKNQPSQKSGLTAYLNYDPRSQRVEAEARFINPALRRPLMVSADVKVEITPVKYQMDSVFIVDVFAQPDQKITVIYKQNYPGRESKILQTFDYTEKVEIRSHGLNIDINIDENGQFNFQQNTYKYGYRVKYHVANSRYDSEVAWDYSARNFNFLLKLYNAELLKVHSQLQLTKEHQVANSEVNVYGYRPLVVHSEIKNWNTLKYTVARKDNPNDKLQVNAGFIPGQIADLRADVIKGGSTKELGHVTIKLDDANFLKSDYNVQSKNIEEFLFKPIKSEVEAEGKMLKQLSEQWNKNAEQELNRLGDIIAKATPNLTPLRQYYVGELNKIKEEILADKTIRDISEFLYNIFGAVSQAAGETFAHFSELVENIARSFQNSFGKVIEVIQKELLPKVKELNDKLLYLVVEIVDLATNVVLTIGAKLAQIAEQYRPELQQLATVLGEVSQDVLRAVVRLYEAVRSVIVDQWQQVYNEIKQLPAVEQFRAEYERFVKHGLPEPEVIANTLKDIVSTLKDIAPTEEIKALIQAIGDYITLKLTSKQPVDDVAAIERIVKAGVAAVSGVVKIITTGEPTPDLQNVKLPLPANLLNKFPRLAAVKFSPFAYLIREDVVLPEDFLLSLVNKPRNWMPPFPLYGLVAQGQHIFTFDGKHLTFPGKCNYVLARDAVDGNFTIVGSYNNGLLTAISLTQGSDTVTLKKHGQVTLNNAPAELPVRKPNVAAYRNNERIVLVSSYGARVTCGPELVVCAINLSGFYHGKIRGLLGNGNNEPYDDFTLPNGKIVTSESEFGNGYKTTSSCGAVQTVSHQGHHPTPACEKLFGWESTLSLCYPFVDVGNFKMACEHGLAAGVKDTEQAIAIAYVAACNQHNIPVRVPSEYGKCCSITETRVKFLTRLFSSVKCTNGDKATVPGDKFSVKTPGKQADIVLLIDTSKENEQVYKEYVQPLVQQLTNELHSKGVSDVEFHIIAYGGDNQWPSHITVAGGKLTFKGKSPNLKFSENPKRQSAQTGCKYIDGLLELIDNLDHDLDLALGQNLQAQTYNEGLEYPFRANAIKSIIAVTSQPCEVGRFYPLQLLRTLLYRNKNINLNLITPISRAGAKSEAKNIVGFNSRNVFSLPGKSKVKSFSDLNRELDYDDYCVDFTVQNDGNVFVSDHILLQAKGTRKQFVQVTSHNIVDQFVGAEKGYDCECKYVTPFTASNVCKLVYTKDKPQA
ncbi:apolipophorin, partial [Asbolus verrucosus]